MTKKWSGKRVYTAEDVNYIIKAVKKEERAKFNKRNIGFGGIRIR